MIVLRSLSRLPLLRFDHCPLLSLGPALSFHLLALLAHLCLLLSLLMSLLCGLLLCALRTLLLPHQLALFVLLLRRALLLLLSRSFTLLPLNPLLFSSLLARLIDLSLNGGLMLQNGFSLSAFQSLLFSSLLAGRVLLYYVRLCARLRGERLLARYAHFFALLALKLVQLAPR